MNGPISSCQYLFGKEAETIFKNIIGMRIDEKRAFIDQCLNLMMRVNVYILSDKDGFCLIDPQAYNDQCHLYSLRAAQIKACYLDKSKEEKLAKTQENRFLHLSLFLNFALAKDTVLLDQVVRKAITDMNEQIPKFKRILEACPFTTFLKDEGRGRERAARIALNKVFKDHFTETLKQPCAENERLYAELSQMANEDLQLVSNRGKKEGIFYTVPKLAGIAYLVDILVKEKIPFVIKVKVITKEGAAGIIVRPSEKILENQIALVFEAIATDEAFSLPECTSKANKCPSYFYGDIKGKHEENDLCFYCKTTTAVDLESYEQRLEQAMESPVDMFYALGADFVIQRQQDKFEHHFKNKEKYPLLSEIFEKAIPKIEELGLGMNNPKTFSVCHVHMDSGSHATSEQLMLDQPPQQFLKERGLL